MCARWNGIEWIPHTLFLLGYGSSAIVYKAIYKPLNRRMALKMIDLDKFERNQIDELRVSCVKG